MKRVRDEGRDAAVRFSDRKKKIKLRIQTIVIESYCCLRRIGNIEIGSDGFAAVIRSVRVHIEEPLPHYTCFAFCILRIAFQ